MAFGLCGRISIGASTDEERPRGRQALPPQSRQVTVGYALDFPGASAILEEGKRAD